jgi:hypothetical protein
MANGTRSQAFDEFRQSRGFAGLASMLVMAWVISLVPTRGMANGGADEVRSEAGGFCSRTATAVFHACGHEVQGDYWLAPIASTCPTTRSERNVSPTPQPRAVKVSNSAANS